MIDRLTNNTGIGELTSGTRIDPASTLNTMNHSINGSVDASNSYLKNFININEEIGDYTRTFDKVIDIITLIPTKRRYIGLEVKFRDSSGNFETIIYNGTSLADSDFTNADNWGIKTTNIIDGGEF